MILEWTAKEGDSPVDERNLSSLPYFLSTSRNENLGGSYQDPLVRLNTSPHR
jgi:hypothetical protein